MEMQVETLAPNVAKVHLAGRMDVHGADKIDLHFNAIAGSHRSLIVDLAGVDFLSSIGIRVLVLGAKTLQRRGGHLVLLSPQTQVLKVLEVVGMLDMLPLAATPDDAARMVGL
jgi:anti-sigma B factor antagonist